MNLFDVPEWAMTNQEKIIREYSTSRINGERKSVPKIAKRLGVTNSWAYRVVKRYQVFLRGQK